MIKGNLLFAQSGGPTAVINASACGVIQTALKQENIENVLCARYGINGVLAEDFMNMATVDANEIELLRYTPSSAFGSCRRKLPPLTQPEVYHDLLEVFKRNNIRYFIYNGGNDSMDTINKVAKYMQENNYECYCVGVPKTVDNDLMMTDHCPGFASAAKYLATTLHEIARDTAVYAHGRVTIVETMGRDTGWLTAATALATAHGAGPDLIYFPEVAFDMESFVDNCKKIVAEKGRCLVALAEGIKNDKGQYITTVDFNANDTFAHAQLGGVASYLANYLMSQHDMASRAIELSLPQRCASHIASKTDADEAYNAGATAVKCALEGHTNQMVIFERTSNAPYTITTSTTCIDNVANAIKHLPEEYIDRENNFVTKQFIDYALPLIQGENPVQFVNGLPRYSAIKVGK